MVSSVLEAGTGTGASYRDISVIDPNSEVNSANRLLLRDWLARNGIVSANRLDEMEALPLTDEERRMIIDNPEHYWQTLYTWRMSTEEVAKLDRDRKFLPNYDQDPEKYHRLYTSTNVWSTVPRILFARMHKRLPNLEENLHMNRYVSPRHRVFFVLNEEGLGEKLRYDFLESLRKEWLALEKEYSPSKR